MSKVNGLRLSADDLLAQWEDASNCLLLYGGGGMDMPRHVYTLDSTPEEYYPLYMETPYATMLDMSPLLVRVGTRSPLLDWFIEEGAWARRGIIVRPAAGFFATVRHLQLILEIRTPSDEILLFRYYDPVVMGYMAQVLLKKPLFRGPVGDFIYPDMSDGGSSQTFLRLYGDVEQSENMRDTFAMTAPMIAFGESDMQTMRDGASAAFSHTLAGRLQKSFPSAGYDSCLEAARKGLRVCNAHGLKNASTQDAAAHLVMALGRVTPRMDEIISGDMNEIHKRSELQRYFKSMNEVPNE